MARYLNVCTASLLMISTSACLDSGVATSLNLCRAEIEVRVRAVQGATSNDARIDTAMGLETYVRNHPGCGESALVVNDISRLLNDDVDGVRMAAAMALGDIGPPARSAVPALRQAIKRSDAILDADTDPLLPVNSSGGAAREALRRITGEKVPSYRPSGIP